MATGGLVMSAELYIKQHSTAQMIFLTVYLPVTTEVRFVLAKYALSCGDYAHPFLNITRADLAHRSD